MKSPKMGMFSHPELYSRCSFLAQRAKNTLSSFTYFFWWV